MKQALIKVGYPVEDLAGYREGEQLELILRKETRGGLSFHLRDYQREAAETFYAAGTARGGSGVVVLPCGAGKTIVGLACMAQTADLHPGIDYQCHGDSPVDRGTH